MQIINLCLNGHEVYTETNSIQVKDGATFAIYDNEGGGRIYGYFVADYPKYGLINIENGGTLVLSEGAIQNLYGSYEVLTDEIRSFLENVIEDGNYEELYATARRHEAENKENLLEYQEDVVHPLSGHICLLFPYTYL